MEQTATRAHAGWREDEIDRLWQEVQQANANGRPLRAVFEEMGESLGRKPNSVRNYYYMQLRAREDASARRATPFETFSEEEVHALVKNVLRARAKGQSVRAAVMALSSGDHTRMLRYQNKYRSVLKKRPQLIEDTLQELRSEGVECKNPLESTRRSTEELKALAEKKADLLGDADIRMMLTGVNALLDRALAQHPQIHHDRLRVRLDMSELKYENLCHAAGDMLMLCKEYLGQEDDVRMTVLPAFLSQLSQRVTQMENAMQ